MKHPVLAIAICLLTACSMDLQPEGQISDRQALDTYKDCRNFWTGLYAGMRTVTSGICVVLSDIQLDDFHAVIDNGNTLMDFWNGNIYPSTAEVAQVYAAHYAVIAQCNYFIDGATPHTLDNTVAGARLDSLRSFLADAHMFRAYAYHQLSTLFCESYIHADTLRPASGLPLTTSYNPNSDNTTYPGRSTLRDTYRLITSDLDTALALKERAGLPTPGNYYVSAEAIKALQARVRLDMGLYESAASIATALTAGGKYPLTPAAQYADLWRYDEGSEIIWRVEADYSHHGPATGAYFMSNISPGASYIPTNEVVYLYELADCRWQAYFAESSVSNSGGEGKVFRLTKYPGNPNIYGSTSQSNFVGMAKPLRSAELYLIAAEAFDCLGLADQAKASLRPLVEARISADYFSHEVAPLTGTNLTEYIHNERRRELIAEGHRLADLKRWHTGFTRGEAQECWDFDSRSCEPLLHSANLRLSYAADDHRLCWPIPTAEFDANPQIKGQQNPGY
jgi:hypothetical protein